MYGIFTYLYHTFKPNLGKSSSPMKASGLFFSHSDSDLRATGRLHEDFGILPDVAARLETRDCEPHQVWTPRWNWRGGSVGARQYLDVRLEVSRRSVGGL